MKEKMKHCSVNVIGLLITLLTICGIATFASYLQANSIVKATEESHDHYQDSWLSNIDSAVEEIDQPTLPAGASATYKMFTLPAGIEIDPTENRQTFYIMDVSGKYKDYVDEATGNKTFPKAYITLSVDIVNNMVDETKVYARLVEKDSHNVLDTLVLTKDSKQVGFDLINAHLADFQPKGGPKGDWRLFFSFENTSTMTFINISGGVPGASTVIYDIVADTKGRIGTQGKVEQQSETLWKALIPKLITMKTRYMLADVENPTFDLSNKEKYENRQFDEKMFVQGNFNGILGDAYTPMEKRNFKGYELFKETNAQPLVGDEYKVGEYYWNTAWAPYGLKELTKVTDITGSGSIEVYTVNPFTNVELIGDQETGYYAIKEDKIKTVYPKFFDTSHDNSEEFLEVYQTPVITPGEYNTFIDSPETANKNVQFKTDPNDQWVMSKKEWDFAAAYPVTYNGKVWAMGTNESNKNETSATKVPVYRTKSVDQKIVAATTTNPPLMNNGFYSKNTQIESDEEVLTANFVMPWRKNPDGIDGKEGIGGTKLVAGNKGWMDPVVYPKGFNKRFGQKSVPLKNELIPHEPKVYYYVPQGKVFVQYKDEDGNTIKEQQTVIEEQNSGTDYNAGGSFQLPTIVTEDGTIYEITPKVEYSSQRLKDIDTPIGTATEPEDGTDKITGKVIAATNQIITYIYKKVPATMTIQKSVTKITDTNDNEYEDQKYHTVGDKIYYAFEVTNTGKATINEVTFNDELLGMTDQKVTVTIEPGKSYTYQVESPYIITQKDLQNAKGKIINVVKATATTPNGGKVPEVSSETETPVESNPAIKLEKTADKTNLVVGETVTYTFTVTNTGNVTLTDVTVTDDKLIPATITLETTTLAPSETTTGTGTYVVTQADVDNVKLVNTAKVTGLPPVTPENPTPTPVEDEDDNTITTTTNPSIKLEKTADKTNLVVGETVTYTFTVTNTGNVTLTDVTVTDDKLTPATITLETTTLAPGETTTGTGTYVVTQADVDNVKLVNTAKVTGLPPVTPENPTPTPVEDEDDNTITTTTNPSIKLEKTADKTNLVVGETVTYTFTVTNTGNVTLTDVTVTDDKLTPATITLEKTTLAPGETTTGSGTYVVTQADVDQTKVINTAKVTGLPPVTPENPTPTPVESEDQNIISNTSNPAIKLEKTADKTNLVVGETVTYTFTVTNTGNVTLTDVTVTDDKLTPATITLEKTTLAPGETTTGTGTYVVTQADVDNVKLVNTAKVTGLPPVTPENPTPTPVESEDQNIISNTSNPAIKLEKTADKTNLVVGETVTYTFTVTNTGNVTLTNVTVTDDKLTPSTITLETTTLAPGETTTGTGTYVVTQTDVDNVKLVNTAKVTGLPPVTPENPTPTPVESEDQNIISNTSNPAIKLEKTADKTNLVVGETVTYTFTVTNTGNVTLTDVTLTDDKLTPSTITLETTTLAPGETTTGTGTYVVTQADVDNVKLVNTAKVTGLPPVTPENPTPTPVESEDQNIISNTSNPAIKLEKTADKTNLVVGETVTYTFTVTNTGNVTLTDVTLTDDKLTPATITLEKTTLAPGEKTTGSGTYVVTQADVDQTKVINTAKVTGLPPVTPENPTPTPVESEDQNIISNTSNPAIKLEKTADKTNLVVGETVTYTFTVTNTGNVTLTNVTVTDDKLTPSTITLETTTLAPGETTTGSGTYVVTQADVDQTKVINTAKVTGLPPVTPENPTPTPVESEDTHTIVNNDNQLSMIVEKFVTKVTDANGTTYEDGKYRQIGDKIFYQFKVTNTSKQTLTKLTFTDELLNMKNISVDVNLKPNEAYTYVVEAPYVITQDDLANESHKVVNVVTVIGVSQVGTPVEGTATTQTHELKVTPEKPVEPTEPTTPEKPVESNDSGQPQPGNNLPVTASKSYAVQMILAIILTAFASSLVVLGKIKK